jgi:2-polyprenyl-3-methyl-5-hydroxy-6-metoxy-1,4-benzoquinol methylase
VRDYRIVECTSCAHGYVETVPSDAELAELYSDAAESFLGSGLAGPLAAYLGDDDRRFFAFHADRLAQISRAGAGPASRILDFGCSQGALVLTLQKKGYANVIGFDRSESAVEAGKRRWGLELVSGSFDDFVARHERSFDIVHAANVLEHVVDPKAILVAFRRLLRPAGRVVLSVPNTRSLQVRIAGNRSPVIDPPHHLQYFGPSSLARLVGTAGFEVTELATEFWQPASDLYLRLKGVPLWMGKAVRYGMTLPGIAINALKLGGVISLTAK